MNYRKTPLTYAVHGEKESPVYGEGTITITVDDEGAGPFLCVRDPEHGFVLIDFDQWFQLHTAAMMLMESHREYIPCE